MLGTVLRMAYDCSGLRSVAMTGVERIWRTCRGPGRAIQHSDAMRSSRCLARQHRGWPPPESLVLLEAHRRPSSKCRGAPVQRALLNLEADQLIHPFEGRATLSARRSRCLPVVRSDIKTLGLVISAGVTSPQSRHPGKVSTTPSNSDVAGCVCSGQYRSSRSRLPSIPCRRTGRRCAPGARPVRQEPVPIGFAGPLRPSDQGPFRPAPDPGAAGLRLERPPHLDRPACSPVRAPVATGEDYPDPPEGSVEELETLLVETAC